jgi:hypothetical protein
LTHQQQSDPQGFSNPLSVVGVLTNKTIKTDLPYRWWGHQRRKLITNFGIIDKISACVFNAKHGFSDPLGWKKPGGSIPYFFPKFVSF